jgi:signal peptidase II
MSLLSAVQARSGYLFLAAAVLVVDQITKIVAHAKLPGAGPVEVVPGFFNLSYSRNPGGLFGYFSDLADPWRTLLLTLFPLLAVGLIVGFLLSAESAERVTLFGLGLILGGALGNLVDRVFRGEVVDFLDVFIGGGRLADWLIDRFGTAHWPTFNVADSGIVVGACLLVSDMVRRRPATKEGAAAADERAAG